MSARAQRSCVEESAKAGRHPTRREEVIDVTRFTRVTGSSTACGGAGRLGDSRAAQSIVYCENVPPLLAGHLSALKLGPRTLAPAVCPVTRTRVSIGAMMVPVRVTAIRRMPITGVAVTDGCAIAIRRISGPKINVARPVAIGLLVAVSRLIAIGRLVAVRWLIAVGRLVPVRLLIAVGGLVAVILLIAVRRLIALLVSIGRLVAVIARPSAEHGVQNTAYVLGVSRCRSHYEADDRCNEKLAHGAS